MPFTGASDPNLPSNVEGLSLETRQQWVGAWNGRFKDCMADGGSTKTCESSAFAVANAAIKEAILKERAVPETNTAEKLSHLDMEPDYWDFTSRRLDQKAANYNPVGGTSEKACSNCQWFIAPNACSVVDSYPDPIVPNGLSDLWRDRFDRFAQTDPLEVVIVGERDADGGTKQETKTEGGVSYPPADFAVVPDAAKPSGWKLRLAEGSAGSITVAQVARAITAMQPGGFRGNRVSLSSDQKTQAISRIGRAIGRTGGTDDQKSDLRERLDAVKAKAGWWEVLVTGPQAIKDLAHAQLKALISLRDLDGDTSDNKDGDAPLTYDSSLTLFKEADGTLRFVALMSNRYRDRDQEIIPAAAHREFVGALDDAGYKNAKGEPAMEAWLWHTPGTKWGEVDWAEYFNGFMVVSGTVDKGYEDVAERLAADPDLGVSHGFNYLTDADDRSIISHYRSFEFSALPLNVASNPYTALAVIQEEAKAMAADNGIPEAKRPFMADKLGEIRAQELEADTARRDAALQTAGVESKATSDGGAPKDPPADAAPAQATNTVQAIAEAAVKAVTESKVMTDMAAAIKVVADGQSSLEVRLTALEKTDDERVGDMFRSRVGSVADQRASQSAETVVSKEEGEKDGAPKFDIVAEVTQDIARMAGIPTGA